MIQQPHGHTRSRSPKFLDQREQRKIEARRTRIEYRELAAGERSCRNSSPTKILKKRRIAIQNDLIDIAAAILDIRRSRHVILVVSIALRIDEKILRLYVQCHYLRLGCTGVVEDPIVPDRAGVELLQ